MSIGANNACDDVDQHCGAAAGLRAFSTYEVIAYRKAMLLNLTPWPNCGQ